MNINNEIKQINKAINELIYPKVALQKAYNYYHSRRDADQFRHIEENYGIGVIERWEKVDVTNQWNQF